MSTLGIQNFSFPVPLSYAAKQCYNKMYDNLTTHKLAVAEKDNEERFLTAIMFKQSEKHMTNSERTPPQ